jgi:cytochrome P450
MNAPVTTAPEVGAWSIPLDKIDVSDPLLYQDAAWQPYFERLRREAPVHYCADSRYGPFWSVSRYNDIMHCEVNHAVFSNEIGGIQV